LSIDAATQEHDESGPAAVTALAAKSRAPDSLGLPDLTNKAWQEALLSFARSPITCLTLVLAVNKVQNTLKAPFSGCKVLKGGYRCSQS